MRRPVSFELDYSHPLAQWLVFAGLGQSPGAARYRDSSLRRANGSVIAYPSGLYSLDETLQRPCLRWPAANSASYIDLSGLLASFTGAFWMAAWVLSSGADWQGHGIFRADNGSAETSLYLAQIGGSPSKWRFRTEVTWSGVNIDSDNGVASNVWQHLFAQRTTDGALSLYVNNVLQAATGTKTGTVPATRAAIGYNYAAGTYAKCLIADVLVGQGRALSPAEISLLADRTDPMLGGLIVEERPVLYFDMGGGTVDALTASNLTISAPVLGTPALGQAHALTASGITVEGPVLGAPALAQIHALTAQNFTASSPVLGVPAVGQVHALTANNLTVSSPVLGTPALTENAADVDALTANDLVVGSPVLGTPAIGQVHVLGSDGLVTGAPVLGQPSMVQIHALSALGLTVGAPVLETPALVAFDIPPVTIDEVSQTIYLQSRIKTVYLKHRIKSARY